MISTQILLVIILIQGWSESGAWKNSLLKKVLESIPNVAVVVPDYLDGKGRFAQFKTHRPVEAYAYAVDRVMEEAKHKYPGVQIMIVGHSLGGVIARWLERYMGFPSRNMVLVGTPNKGITYKTFGGNAGIVVLPLLKILASKHLCNVPVFYQLLEGSKFFEDLNKKGIPKDAFYISGGQDEVVPLWSSDPHGIGEIIPCGHHLFPNEEELAESSAIPVVERIVREKIAKLKAGNYY